MLIAAMTAKTLLRASACAVVSTAALLALTGCENFYHFGPYELGFDGEHLLIASCDERDVASVFVEERGASSGNEGRRHVWEAVGEHNLASGGTLVVGGANRGLVNELSSEVIPQSGMRYFVEVSDHAGTTSALFKIPEGGIPRERWLNPRGDISDEPCSLGK